jgi:hypothetical protein
MRRVVDQKKDDLRINAEAIKRQFPAINVEIDKFFKSRY